VLVVVGEAPSGAGPCARPGRRRARIRTPTVRGKPMNPPRILIADPDPVLLDSYGAALARQGFDVTTAPDGLKCVGLLRAFAPDVIVLSPALPWGGGDGVLAVMTEESRAARVPVIVLS